MLSDSHFEIEKRRDSWRLSARGLPALAVAFAVGAIGIAGAFWWMGGHVQSLH